MSELALNQSSARPESPDRVVAPALVRGFDLAWMTLAATLIPVSLIWDFSWESTVGVDRFWSPPHVATHAGVWLSGLLGVWLVVVFNRAHRPANPAPGIDVLGMRGPVGAWVLTWSAGIMLGAFLLDDWWQKAYGLGAGIWPPPQLLKTVGFFATLTGGLMLCCGAFGENAVRKKTATRLLLWQGGLLLAMAAVVLSTRTYPNWQHGAFFYQTCCAVFPAILLMIGQASQRRWGATCAALAYLIVWGGMVWVLPLFPARPLTAPIHNPMDHMMPPPFPLLLVGPALVMDLVRARLVPQWIRNRELILAVVLGIAFGGTFFLTQWFFASFLLSPASNNWFFAGGGRHWPFFLKIDQARVLFWDAKSNPFTWKTGLLASGWAVASTWLGLRLGGWLSKLRR